LAQKVSAEPRGERWARQIDNVSNAFQSDPRQSSNRLLRQSQCCKRQRCKKLAFAPEWHDGDVIEMRRRPGRADGRGDGGTS
jgi:hypothetical protein